MMTQCSVCGRWITETLCKNCARNSESETEQKPDGLPDSKQVKYENPYIHEYIGDWAIPRTLTDKEQVKQMADVALHHPSASRGDKKLGPFCFDTYFGKKNYPNQHENSVLSKQILLNKSENKIAAQFLASELYAYLDYICLNDMDGFLPIGAIDLIIPIPNTTNVCEHTKAVSIGIELSILSHIPYISDILKKTKGRDKNQGKTERQKSANEIYKINNSVPIKDKRIILVDDVKTTGATIDKCANLLLENGANQIITVCVAENYYV
jgi:predicted amidophosphoribosyltransferase